MYFPGDPLFAHDPIFNSIPDERARERLVSSFDLSATVPEWALALRVGHRAARQGRDPGRGGRRVSAAAHRRRRPSGPFFSLGLPWADGPFVVPEGTAGARVDPGPRHRRRGRTGPRRHDRDVAGRARRALRPSDDRGRATTGFRGFGAVSTDAAGRFAILTVKPGGVPAATAGRRRTSASTVFARGLLKHLVTRIYFGDEEAANARDPVLAR